MIARGMFHLARSAVGETMSDYHLQAGVAAVHCAAKDYESTDWAQILSLYDRLVELDNSPVVALNRAVALTQVHGARSGLEAVDAIANPQALESYYLFYAVRAELEWQLSDYTAATEHFRQALKLTEVKSEQLFLSKRLRECEEQCFVAVNS